MNKKRHKVPSVPELLQPDDIVGPFSLSFLEEGHGSSVQWGIYELELLTAEEKATYYQDRLINQGPEDAAKIAKDCRKKAVKLLSEARDLDPDEAKPLLRKAQMFEALASGYEIPDDQDEPEAQRQPFELDPIDDRLINEEGLPTLPPATPGSVEDPEQRTAKELKDLKKKALFWRKIHQWDMAQAMAYYFPGPLRPSNWEEAIFVRAQKDPFPLTFLLSNARGPVERLLELAKMGNAQAAKAAADLLEDLVRKLNLYAKANPGPFREAAREMTHWPVMYSNHQKLNQDPVDVAQGIQLGEDYPFYLDPMAKWDPRQVDCKVALRLFRHVETVRRHPETHKNLPYVDRARILPEIHEPAAPSKWWQVAEAALLHGVPKPERDKFLSQLALGEATRKYPSRMHQRILAKLKARFLKLFPKAKRS